MDVRRTSTCAAVLAVLAASSAGCGTHRTTTAPERARTAITLAELRGHIVFSRLDDNLWTANADGSALRRLTTGPGEDGWPAWSPDGRSIAFVAARGPGNQERSIWIMRSDGSGKRRVAKGEYPVWSPDGRFLMFQVVDQLFVVRP